MRSTREVADARAKEIIDYFTTTAGHSKTLTHRYFRTQGKIRGQFVSSILQRYERTGSYRSKNPGIQKNQHRKTTLEILEKMKPLVEKYPDITGSEAAEIFNLTRSTAVRFKRLILNDNKSKIGKEDEQLGSAPSGGNDDKGNYEEVIGEQGDDANVKSLVPSVRCVGKSKVKAVDNYPNPDPIKGKRKRRAAFKEFLAKHSRAKRPTRKVAEERAKEIIDYYTTTANFSKTLTYSYFKKQGKIRREFVGSTLQRYKLTGSHVYTVTPLPKVLSRTSSEKIEKLRSLLERDPDISSTEAAEILKISRSAANYMKKHITKHQKPVEAVGNDKEQIQSTWNEDDGNHWEPEDVGCDDGDDAEVNSQAGFGNEIPIPKERKREVGGGPKRFCLACLKKFTQVHNGKTYELRESVDAFIVLRKVLNIPSEDIVSLLGKLHGNGPSFLTVFCQDCACSVKKALAIQKQILELEKRMAECQRNIEETVRRKVPNKIIRQVPKGVTMIRQIIQKRLPISPPQTNPFLEGDTEAEHKCIALQPVNCNEILVKEEVEIREEEEDTFELEDSFETDMEYKPEDVAKQESLIKQDPHCLPHFQTKSADSASVDFAVPLITNVSRVDEALNEVNPESSGPKKESMTQNHNPDPNSSNKVDVGNSGNASTTPRTSNLELCDECGEYMRPLLLPLHKLREHDITMEGYTARRCPVVGCNYSTLYACRFREHTRKHRTDRPRPHICQYCGKTFAELQNKKRHEQIHQNAETKPYQCEICGSSFAVVTYLYLHKRLSHQKRPFPSTGRKIKGGQVSHGGGEPVQD